MKLLITGAISWKEEQKKELREMGHELIYIQDERIPLREQGIALEDIEGIIGNGIFLYNEISDFHSLKYIQLTSAGFDRVPMDYIREHQIEIHNARGVYSVPMAEFALCGILQLYKQSRFFYENQKKCQWIKHRGLMELTGKTVCIFGCGSVGTECAKRFSAFGCRVIGIDLYPRKDIFYDSMIELQNMGTVLPEADIIVLTLPLTDDTRHFLNQQKFNELKRGAILVNIGRGALIDTDVLIKEMEHLGGAVLDVLEDEPLGQNSPLWTMENVIITPHNSFVGDENRERLNRLILKNIGER